jgi:DNA-binding phage protein
MVGENSIAFGLTLVPRGHQLLGIFKDLAIRRAAGSGFLLRLLPAGVLHFALVESHGAAIMDQRNGRIEVGRKQMSRLVRVFDDKDVVELLHSSVKRAGGQSAFARQTGVDRTHLNHVLTGKRLPTSSILKSLNLGIVYVALQSAGLAARKMRPRRRHS